MKILIVASHKPDLPERVAPFIQEQVAALRALGLQVAYFTLRGKGLWGYLRELPRLRRALRACRPQVVHAHYGLAGLLANLQRRVPVVTTFHGSDVNGKAGRFWSLLALRLSAYSLFANRKMMARLRPASRALLLPCGIPLEAYAPRPAAPLRARLGWAPDRQYVLFAGAFANPVKNAPLARAAVARLPGVELRELRGYSRAEVANLLYAADALLLTSFSEGSPQVVKEALACGCPVVSVDVGDVAERIAGVAGCFLAEPHAADLAAQLQKAFVCKPTRGREMILAQGLDNARVAARLIAVYELIAKE